MKLNNWYAVKVKADAIYHAAIASGADTLTALKTADEYLQAVNAGKPVERQCEAFTMTDDNGLPTLGYCKNYECWRCGTYRVFLDVERAVSGMKRGAVYWFATFTRCHPDGDHRQPDTPDTMQTFAASVTRILDALRKQAGRAGHRLEYFTFDGFKDTGELHTHAVLSWLPDAEYQHTRGGKYDVYRSAWLDAQADAAAITVYLERVADVYAVAGYIRHNVNTTLGRLPGKWRRVRFSKSWISRKQIPMRVFVSACRNCGQVAFAGDAEQMPGICRCGSSDFGSVRKTYVSVSALPLADVQPDADGAAITGRQSYSIYRDKTGQNRNLAECDTGTPDTRTCTRCGHEHPLTPDYWHSNGRGGYMPRCKDCENARHRKRYETIRRQCVTKAADARKVARRHGVVSTLTADDIERRYHAADGECEYCATALGDAWQIDHVHPVSRGGGNTPDNIRVTCVRCNQRKKAMRPRRWITELAALGVRHPDAPDTLPIQDTFFDATEGG